MARLPFDTRRLDTKMRIFDLRDWKNTPRINVSREFERDISVDEVACEVANEVIENADTNDARIFYYNMMSRSDFRNEDFERLVQFVADYMELRVVAREARRVSDDLRTTIHNAVAIHLGKQTLEFPELLDEVSGQAARALETNARKFRDIEHEFRRLMGDADRGSRDDDRGRGDYRSQYSSSRGRDRDYDRRGRYQDDRGDRYRNDRDGARSGREVTGDVYDRNDYPQFVRMEERNDARSVRDSRRAGAERFDREEERSLRGNDHRGNVRGNFTSDDDLTFAPTGSFPPAPPPPADQAVEKILEEHSLTNPVSKDVVNTDFGQFPAITRIKESDMDKSAHSVVYPADTQAGEAMFKEALKVASLEAAVMDPAVTSEQIENSVENVTEIKIFNSVGELALSVSEASAMMMVEKSGENTDGTRLITHTHGVVGNTVVGFSHLTSIQKQLRQCATLREIATILRHALVSTDKHSTPAAAFATDLRSTVIRFDRVLTNEINMFCRDVIRVTSGNAIRSFKDNFDDLIESFAANATKEQNNALLMFLSDMMSSYKECLVPSLHLEQLILPVEDGENSTFGMAMLPFSYLVTHIPFTMAELGVDTTGATALGRNDISSFMHQALDVSKVSETDFAFCRRLLVTRDLEVFRVFKVPGGNEPLVLVPLHIV